MAAANPFWSARVDSSRALADQLNQYGSHRTEQRGRSQLLDQDVAQRAKAGGAADGQGLQQPSLSMQDMISSAKDLCRDALVRRFPYIKEICTLPDVTMEESAKAGQYQKMMEDIRKSDQLLYPPST